MEVEKARINSGQIFAEERPRNSIFGHANIDNRSQKNTSYGNCYRQTCTASFLNVRSVIPNFKLTDIVPIPMSKKCR